MGELLLVAIVLAVSVLVTLVVVVLLVVRRLVLARVLASFDCAVRTRRGPYGWSAGVARYGPDRIDWFRVFSLNVLPTRTFERRRLALVGSTAPAAGRAVVLQSDVCVVSCRYDGTDLDLAMTVDALTGLSSWLEAAPPGPVRPHT